MISGTALSEALVPLPERSDSRRRGSEPEPDPGPGAYLLGDVVELDEPLHHHTVQINGTGVGAVDFQGSLDGEHWHTMARLTLTTGRDAHFLGSPARSELTPTTWLFLRVVARGTVTGGPFTVWFASS